MFGVDGFGTFVFRLVSLEIFDIFFFSFMLGALWKIVGEKRKTEKEDIFSDMGKYVSEAEKLEKIMRGVLRFKNRHEIDDMQNDTRLFTSKQ